MAAGARLKAACQHTAHALGSCGMEHVNARCGVLLAAWLFWSTQWMQLAGHFAVGLACKVERPNCVHVVMHIAGVRAALPTVRACKLGLGAVQPDPQAVPAANLLLMHPLQCMQCKKLGVDSCSQC